MNAFKEQFTRSCDSTMSGGVGRLAQLFRIRQAAFSSFMICNLHSESTRPNCKLLDPSGMLHIVLVVRDNRGDKLGPGR
jgi:hypothetical protein